MRYRQAEDTTAIAAGQTKTGQKSPGKSPSTAKILRHPSARSNSGSSTPAAQQRGPDGDRAEDAEDEEAGAEADSSVEHRGEASAEIPPAPPWGLA